MKPFTTFAEAQRAWQSDREHWAAMGAAFPSVVAYTTPAMKRDVGIAMDALAPILGMDATAPVAIQTDPNSGVPAMLTTLIDPEVFEIRFAPNNAVQVMGEQKKGSWTDETAMFPQIEHTGEVTSYGDYNTGGRTGVNTTWPQRQAYRFQTVKEYGELELARAGLAKVNWVSEMDRAAAAVMNKFENLSYFFGIDGLQNYGILNDPDLPASLTPATKAATGTSWSVATANEIFDDVKTLITALISATAGLVTKQSNITLALSPTSEAYMAATNSFNVSVSDLLKKNYPGLKIVTAVQYGAKSADNPEGVAAGELVQAIATDVDGQKTGYCSFNEKMRAHPVIRDLSSFKQKVSGGTWGAIIRMPVAIQSMVGI